MGMLTQNIMKLSGWLSGALCARQPAREFHYILKLSGCLAPTGEGVKRECDRATGQG
jgi:hypothetical protein